MLGTDSRRLGPRELARIGYVSENQQLPDWMTPQQLTAYVQAVLSNLGRAHCAASFNATWPSMARKPLRMLSRGTRMKVALLVSLAYRPELIILDEPFTGLDPLVRDELIRALLELTGEYRWTTLISSHDIDEVERLADSIAFIDNGRITFTDSVQALIERAPPASSGYFCHVRPPVTRASHRPGGAMSQHPSSPPLGLPPFSRTARRLVAAVDGRMPSSTRPGPGLPAISQRGTGGNDRQPAVLSQRFSSASCSSCRSFTHIRWWERRHSG